MRSINFPDKHSILFTVLLSGTFWALSLPAMSAVESEKDTSKRKGIYTPYSIAAELSSHSIASSHGTSLFLTPQTGLQNDVQNFRQHNFITARTYNAAAVSLTKYIGTVAGLHSWLMLRAQYETTIGFRKDTLANTPFVFFVNGVNRDSTTASSYYSTDISFNRLFFDALYRIQIGELPLFVTLGPGIQLLPRKSMEQSIRIASSSVSSSRNPSQFITPVGWKFDEFATTIKSTNNARRSFRTIGYSLYASVSYLLHLKSVLLLPTLGFRSTSASVLNEEDLAISSSYSLGLEIRFPL